MSRPIDIPIASQRQPHEHVIQKSEFPLEAGPYFGFIEVFEGDNAHWMVSGGFGKYVEVREQRPLPPLVFIIEKNRGSNNIAVDIISPQLKQTIHQALLRQNIPPSRASLGFENLLHRYEVLKNHLRDLGSRSPKDQATVELHLLIHDVLLDRALYDGIAMDEYRYKSHLSAELLQDLHHQTISSGLDEIDEDFALGLIPQDANDNKLHTLDHRIRELACSGDQHSLSSLCEPVVRSGEIEIQYDPSTLLDILESGQLDAFEYLLNLMRLSHDEPKLRQNQTADVTYHPMHVAIRLGHVRTVQTFIHNNTWFEGSIPEFWLGGSHIFTPLSTAVLWRQPDVVRLLLRSGPIYTSRYHEAATLASSGNYDEIIPILVEFEHEQLASPLPITYLSPSQLGSDGPNSGATVRRNKLSYSESSTSELTRGLSNLGSGLAAQLEQFGIESPFRSETLSMDQGTQNGSDFDSSFFTSQKVSSRGELIIVKHTLAYEARRARGWNLAERLQYQCARALSYLKRAEIGDMNEIARQFSAEYVWRSGLKIVRRAFVNKSPTGLMEPLHCLLVTDALASVLSREESSVYSQYTADMERWTFFMQDQERTLFSKVVSAVWGADQTPEASMNSEMSDSFGLFQTSIQGVVSNEEVPKRGEPKQPFYGACLHAIQERFRHRLKASTPRQYSACLPSLPNWGNDLAGLVDTQTPHATSAIDLDDFLYLEELQEDPTRGTANRCSKAGPFPWKSIDPGVVVVLGSVAFSVVLGMIAISQDERSADSILHIFRAHAPSYDRSRLVIDKFCDITGYKDESISTRRYSFSTDQSYQDSLIQRMKAASTIDPDTDLLSRSLDSSLRSHGPALSKVMSDSSISKLSTSLSAIETSKSIERVRCLSLTCPKTFSSISNRNKHMRDGCAYRENRGYPCRNDGCTKVLTTKWYRNTHEGTRCRYRSTETHRRSGPHDGRNYTSTGRTAAEAITAYQNSFRLEEEDEEE